MARQDFIPIILRPHTDHPFKWMLFIPPNEVNEVWAVVARATALGDLGTAAKVAPNDGDAAQLICIYTEDFTDLEDIERVLRKLKDLGLFNPRGRPIYYKAGRSIHE